MFGISFLIGWSTGSALGIFHRFPSISGRAEQTFMRIQVLKYNWKDLQAKKAKDVIWMDLKKKKIVIHITGWPPQKCHPWNNKIYKIFCNPTMFGHSSFQSLSDLSTEFHLWMFNSLFCFIAIQLHDLHMHLYVANVRGSDM